MVGGGVKYRAHVVGGVKSCSVVYRGGFLGGSLFNAYFCTSILPTVESAKVGCVFVPTQYKKFKNMKDELSLTINEGSSEIVDSWWCATCGACAACVTCPGPGLAAGAAFASLATL